MLYKTCKQDKQEQKQTRTTNKMQNTLYHSTKEISTQEAQCSVSDTASVEQFYTISPCPHFLPWNPNFWYSSSLGQKEKKFKSIFQKNEN